MLKERRFHAGIVTVLNAPVAQRIFIHRKGLVATGIEVERFKNRTDGTDIETLLIWIMRILPQPQRTLPYLEDVKNLASAPDESSKNRK